MVQVHAVTCNKYLHEPANLFHCKALNDCLIAHQKLSPPSAYYQETIRHWNLEPK